MTMSLRLQKVQLLGEADVTLRSGPECNSEFCRGLNGLTEGAQDQSFWSPELLDWGFVSEVLSTLPAANAGCSVVSAS